MRCEECKFRVRGKDHILGKHHNQFKRKSKREKLEEIKEKGSEQIYRSKP